MCVKKKDSLAFAPHAVEGRMRAVLVEQVPYVFHEVDGVASGVGLDVRGYLEVVAVRSVQEVRHHRVCVVGAAGRRPGDHCYACGTGDRVRALLRGGFIIIGL